MVDEYDVIVIGAGVTGAAVARELSRYQLKTIILEREVDVSFGTSKANSGIIHAGFHSPPETLKGQLAAAGNAMFDQLCQELAFPFQRRGELMVAFNDEELRVLQFYYERGQQNRVPQMELLGRERTLELEPHLTPDVEGALLAPTAGVICPYEYCFSMIENARQNGVQLQADQEVVAIEKEKNLFSVSTAQGHVLKSRYIVNAAGLFADEIAAMAGVGDFKIMPRKGEEYLLDRRVNRLVSRIIFPCPSKTSKGMLIIPTVDGPVMVGPTAEDIEDKTDFNTTRQGLKKIFQHAQKMIPEIRATDAITSFVGLRPAATGGDFIIGPTKNHGFINAAGIQSPGLTASPVIGKRIVEILQQQGLKMPGNTSFSPYREKKITHLRPLVEARDFQGIEALVARDPRYSHLVCRCENVTEAEIIGAIRQGHTTLDGIKFATRCGTGRCQGGFCTTRLLEILQRETGIPLEALSKKGAGSEIAPIRLNKGAEHS